MSTPSRFLRTLRALLPVVAILAPASILAVLGLRAYSAEALLLRQRYERDQVGIMRLVGKRLSDEARRAFGDLAARCKDRDPDAALDLRFIAAQPLARHIFLLRGDRLVYPLVPPARVARPARPSYVGRYIDQYFARIKRQRRHDRLISRGLRAEYRGDLRRALRIYVSLARRHEPRALLGLARLRRSRREFDMARAAYRTLSKRFAGRQDAEGIDYGLIADAGLADLGGQRELLGLHQRLAARRYRADERVRRFYLRWAVGKLAARAPGSAELERVERRTRHLFDAERFGRRLLRLGVTELSQLAKKELRSVAVGHRTVLVLRRRAGVGFSEVLGFALADDALRGRLAEQRRDLPSTAAGFVLSLSRAGEVEGTPAGRAFYRAPLDPPLNHWTLLARRRTADPSVAAQRQSERRQLGVIFGLLALMVSGLFFTYRGVRRELDLAQLKSDFVSTVSHELKTPLTSIRMFAEMLQEGIADSGAARERYQLTIIRESERLGQLITNVLDFSRVERGTRRYDLQAEPVESLAREAVETFRRLSDAEEVKVRFAPPGDLPHVLADREAAVTSLLNLLSNAAKYSRGHPEIEVRFEYERSGQRARHGKGGGGKCGQKRGEVGVAVVDEGIGVPQVEHERIFDDFHRAPGAREAGVEGTGLGLALVRRHMEACRGRVSVESAPGKGSTFTLWFRIAEEEGRGQYIGD